MSQVPLRRQLRYRNPDASPGHCCVRRRPFADVLVHADGVTYRVCDLEEFQQAHGRGLILPGEARGAQRGLAELTGIIERGELVAFLRHTCHVGPLNPPIASPADRTSLTHVPLPSEENRATWAEREDLRDMP
jgi:hypothetical protein